MTPAEFNELLEGWEWRYRHRMDTAARWVAVLISAVGHLKHNPSAQELLGRPLQPHLPEPTR